MYHSYLIIATSTHCVLSTSSIARPFYKICKGMYRLQPSWSTMDIEHLDKLFAFLHCQSKNTFITAKIAQFCHHNAHQQLYAFWAHARFRLKHMWTRNIHICTKLYKKDKNNFCKSSLNTLIDFFFKNASSYTASPN